MKQKLILISSLIHSPKLLVLDEPFVGLDPKACFIVKNIMKDFAKEGNAIFFSTHVLEVAEKLCNKVAIIDNAKIVEIGETQEIFLYPKTEISKKIIYSGHINTKSDDSKLLKVIFNGELDMPLIANIVQDCNIVLSVIYADSKVVNGRVFGQLIFKMPADINDVLKLRKYLELKGINYKEVDASEFFWDF